MRLAMAGLGLLAVAVVWFLIRQSANPGGPAEDPASPISAKCDSADVAAQRVLEAAPWYDFWTSSADLWPAKQFNAAAQFHCPPAHLKDELAKNLPEVVSAAPRAGKLARLRWAQAGDVALALFHLPEAEQYYQRAIGLPAGEGQVPSRWQLEEKLADVYHAEGRYDVESLQRQLSASGRENAGQVDPAPLLSATRMAVCFYDLHRPTNGLALLDERLKSAPAHLDANHPDLAVARAFHSLLLRDTNQPAACEAEVRQILADTEKAFGKDDPQTVLAKGRLLLFLATSGRGAEVEQMAPDTIKELGTWFGQDHPVTRLVVRDVGVAAANAGDTQQAQLLLRNLLEVDRKILPPNDPQIGDDLSGLAAVATKMNRLSEAESLLRDALKCYQASLSPDSPRLTRCLRTLAGVQAQMAGSDDAEKELRRVLATLEADHPEGSLEIARHLVELGRLLYRQQRLGEAESDLRLGCEMVEKFGASDSLELANALQNLGAVLIREQQYVDAERIFQRVTALKEKLLGPSSSEMVATLTFLGQAQMGTKSWKDAQQSLKRALDLSVRTLGADSMNTSEVLSSLAALYYGKRPGDALTMERQALAIVEHNLGKESPRYTQLLTNIATTLAKLERNDEAEKMLQQAIAIDEAVRPDDPRLASHLSALATIHSQLHEISEADALFRRALGMLVRGSKNAGGDFPELQSVSAAYSTFLQTAGLKPDEITARLDHIRRGEEVAGL